MKIILLAGVAIFHTRWRGGESFFQLYHTNMDLIIAIVLTLYKIQLFGIFKLIKQGINSTKDRLIV